MQVRVNRSLNCLVLIGEESLGEPFVELCNRGKQFCLYPIEKSDLIIGLKESNDVAKTMI